MNTDASLGRPRVIPLLGAEWDARKLAAGMLLLALGTGFALGYAVQAPKVERADRVRATRKRMRELDRR